MNDLAESSVVEPVEQAPLRPRGSNQVGMRQFNERVVLQALRTHGSLAKAEMARVTGLTAQTIGLITARLDEDQLLRREAPVFRDPKTGIVSVSTYDLVLEVNKKPKVFSSDFSALLSSGGSGRLDPEEEAIPHKSGDQKRFAKNLNSIP